MTEDQVTTPVEPIPPVLLGDFSFLCGQAGTGKTYLMRRMVRELPGTVLAASTGIAACNLGEGTTINALLSYFDTASLVEAYTSGFLTARLGKLWRSGVRRIALDEISMTPADQVTVITRALEELRGRGYVMNQELADEVAESGEDAHNGISLILCGDMAQLGPVKDKYAFESAEWSRYANATHMLTKIHRQADPAFIQALQAARVGDKDTVCDYFTGRMAASHDPHYQGLTVMATNDAVDRFNALRMDGLTTSPVVFTSERWGTARGDWKNIATALTLKEGALVMILANRREGDGSDRLVYANGDLGVISQIDAGHSAVHVTLQRNGKTHIVDWVTRENVIPLEPGRKKALTLAGNAHLVRDKWEIVGEVTYLPIRPAWASTTHKCQGLSCDAVQVNSREGMFRQSGLLYVALSRARTAEGLRLVGTVDGLRERVTVDAKVKPWI